MSSLGLDIRLDPFFNAFGVLGTELLLQNLDNLLNLVCFLAQHFFLAFSYDALGQATLVGRDLILELLDDILVLALIDLLVQLVNGLKSALTVGIELGGASLTAFFAYNFKSYSAS